MHPYIHLMGVEVASFGLLQFVGVLSAWCWLRTRALLSMGASTATFFTALACGGVSEYALKYAASCGVARSVPGLIGGIARQGGFFYGVLAAGALGVWSLAAWRRRSFMSLAAPIIVVLPWMQACGRIGCLLAGCCYGRPIGALGVGMVFSDPRGLAPVGVPLYPTELYESLGCIGIFAGLFVAALRARAIVLPTYLMAYGSLRSGLECIRGDYRPDVLAGAMSVSQALSICAVMLGLALLGREFWPRRITAGLDDMERGCRRERSIRGRLGS